MKPVLPDPVLDQHFYFSLGIFQDFQATFGETNAFFEDLQGFIERQITLFQLTDDRFQSGHRLFEFDPAHDGTTPFLECEGHIIPSFAGVLHQRIGQHALDRAVELALGQASEKFLVELDVIRLPDDDAVAHATEDAVAAAENGQRTQV